MVVDVGPYLHYKTTFEEVSSRFVAPVEIGFNFGKSFFIPRDHLNLSLSWANYAELEKRILMAKERGVINREDKDVEVKAFAILNKTEPKKIRLRLRGTYLDHAEGDKWSFRVKVSRKDSLRRMNRFSLQNPSTRMWLWEWLYQRMLKHVGLMYLDYGFLDLSVNGEPRGVYAIEEFMHPNLVEKNKRRDGLLLKANTFLFNEKKIGKSAKLTSFRESYSSVYQRYTREEILLGDIYDLDKLAQHFAVTQIFGSGHSHFKGNWITYFNPITEKLEVIGYDSNSGRLLKDARLQIEHGAVFFFGDMHIRKFFDNAEFVERYLYYLLKFSEENFMRDFFGSIEKPLSQALKMIWRQKPWQTADYYKKLLWENQDYVRSYLDRYLDDDPNITAAELEGFMSAHNMGGASGRNLNYSGVEYLDRRGNTERFGFIKKGADGVLTIRAGGAFILTEDLVVPADTLLRVEPGVSLRLDKFSITSFSPVELVGTTENPIRIFGGAEGNGIVVLGASGLTSISNTIFEDLKGHPKNTAITGSVTFYESDVRISDSIFDGNQGLDDHLNIIRSNFAIENTKFLNSFSDAIDIDFSEGVIKQIIVDDAGNDGIDFSNSVVVVENSSISKALDKAISVGESTQAQIQDVRLAQSKVGIAVKDSSVLNGKEIGLGDLEFGVALYKKKKMYGLPEAMLSSLTFEKVNREFFIERGATLQLDGSTIAPSIYDSKPHF